MNYSVLNNWPNKSNTVNTGREAEPFIPAKTNQRCGFSWWEKCTGLEIDYCASLVANLSLFSIIIGKSSLPWRDNKPSLLREFSTTLRLP